MPHGSSPTSSAEPGTPERWKSILVTFVVVFPTVEFLTRVVAPRLMFMPAILRDAVVVAGMCVALSYAIPVVNQWFRRWITP